MAEFRNPFSTLTKLPNRQRLHIYYHCNRYFYNNSYLSLLYVYINTQQKCNVKLCYFVAHLIFIYWSRPTSLHSLRPFCPIRHVNIENNRKNEIPAECQGCTKQQDWWSLSSHHTWIDLTFQQVGTYQTQTVRNSCKSPKISFTQGCHSMRPFSLVTSHHCRYVLL